MLIARRAVTPRPDRRRDGNAAALRPAVDARVLERFAPAHVVVSRDGDVVHCSRRTGRYLEQPAGSPSHQLVAMVRKGLSLDLRAALQEAVETRRTVVREGIMIETDDRLQPISLTVEPFGDRDTGSLFLVLFTDLGPSLTPEQAAWRLQPTIEDDEPALQQLTAANEELVAMNEELQTVRAELGEKVDQLNLANADLSILLDSTRIAVLSLDQQLMIRSFTPTMTEIFGVVRGDRGRPLAGVATSLDYPELASDLRKVMADGEEVERQVARGDGSIRYLARILPCRTEEGRVSGTLVTFVDVTNAARAEQRQRLLVDELNHRVRNMLAEVSAIASQTLAHAKEPDAFAARFLGRLQALARSHGLLARERWADGKAAAQLRLDGPAVLVKPKTALALGLIAHELATNALKHGAPSSPEGWLEVTWAIAGDEGGRRLMLRWKERGHPVPWAAGEPGLGITLIDREVQHELGGTIEGAFGPDGFTMAIALPIAVGPAGSGLLLEERAGGR